MKSAKKRAGKSEKQKIKLVWPYFKDTHTTSLTTNNLTGILLRRSLPILVECLPNGLWNNRNIYFITTPYYDITSAINLYTDMLWTKRYVVRHELHE